MVKGWAVYVTEMARRWREKVPRADGRAQGRKLEDEEAAVGLVRLGGGTTALWCGRFPPHFLPSSFCVSLFLSISSLSLTGPLFIFLSCLWSFVSLSVYVDLPRHSVSSLCLSVSSPLHVSLPPCSFPIALSVSPNIAVTYLQCLSCWVPSLPH